MLTRQDKLVHVLVALCSVGALLILSRMLRYANYGFDFTDESYYLVWIANPFIYDVSLTQFGFIYHPLYYLFGGDVADLRRVNIVITFVLAWCLVYRFLISLGPTLPEKKIYLLVISSCLATSSLVFFSSWLVSPSYNGLNFQALLITAIGLILVGNVELRTSLFGWLLICVGGWLCFMAKISTALPLAGCVLIYLIIVRKLNLRMIILSIACLSSLFLFSALAIDGSLSAFVNRIRVGLDTVDYLGSGHSLSGAIRIDDFYLDEKTIYIFRTLIVVLVIALVSIFSRQRKWKIIGIFISIMFLLITASYALLGEPGGIGLGVFQSLIFFSLSFSVIIAGLILGRLKTVININLQQWAIAALFLIMPHLYAFGTGNNYWQQAGGVAIFWLLAGLVFIAPEVRERSSWIHILPLAFAVPAVTAVLVQKGFEQPYRQPQSLTFNNALSEIGQRNSKLLLSGGYSTYLEDARSVVQKSGFVKNTPVIDLSGQSPGILFAIGAESIGQAWTIGGYPGSLKLAEFAFGRVACEKIANAWVLHEPNGPRSLPVLLMTNIGMNFPNDYKNVGSWHTASGAGGYLESRQQNLYLPVNIEKSMAKCNAIREISSE